MLQTYKHIRQYAVFYLLCFAAYFGWSFWHGLTFTQIKPVFFYNQLDLTGNIMLLTKIHLYLLTSQTVRITFDLLYILLPVLLTALAIRQSPYQTLAAIVLILFNMVYAFCFSIMSFVSIKVMLAFMIVPIVFLFKKPRNFFMAVEGVRLLFILFFFSTAVWKIRAGGIFNIDQMSGILINQHNYLFINEDTSHFKSFIAYLIERPSLSYALYFAATLAEMLFIIGFFTKKFDKGLIILFLLFVSMNYLVMHINYFSWLPFLGCLYFSKFTTETTSNYRQPFNSADFE